MRFIETAAAAGLLATAPLAAQSTSAPATPTPTPTPTPSPAPAGDVVGPPQLRDFNLNGTTTQPAPRPAPTATPTPTPAPEAAPRSTAAGATPPSRPRARPAPVAVSAPTERRPTAAAPDRNPAGDAVTVDLPPPSAGPMTPAPSFAPALPFEPEVQAASPAAAEHASGDWWPWLAALLALGLGAALLFWQRQRGRRDRYAADGAGLGGAVPLPAAPPEPLSRAARNVPTQRFPTPTPTPSPRAPSPAPAMRAPLPAVPPRSPAPSSPIAGGIVASGLKPRIEFELVPDRAETDAAEGAALTASIILVNRGSAPARDVVVEARLINAGPQVDAEIGQYFTRARGTGERVPMIPPMGRVALKVRLEVAGAKLAPLVVEGRKLLVPMVAINAFYRWSGGEMSGSSSFIVGRGDAEEGKLAPFRIDQGARSWTGLAARLHSTGLQR